MDAGTKVMVLNDRQTGEIGEVIGPDEENDGRFLVGVNKRQLSVEGFSDKAAAENAARENRDSPVAYPL